MPDEPWVMTVEDGRSVYRKQVSPPSGVRRDPASGEFSWVGADGWELSEFDFMRAAETEEEFEERMGFLEEHERPGELSAREASLAAVSMHSPSRKRSADGWDALRERREAERIRYLQASRRMCEAKAERSIRKRREERARALDRLSKDPGNKIFTDTAISGIDPGQIAPGEICLTPLDSSEEWQVGSGCFVCHSCGALGTSAHCRRCFIANAAARIEQQRSIEGWDAERLRLAAIWPEEYVRRMGSDESLAAARDEAMHRRDEKERIHGLFIERLTAA